MIQLSKGGRTNILAKGIGTMRSDKKDSRFPVMRMPMGLVEYTAQFFAADYLQQVYNAEVCKWCIFLIKGIMSY